MDERQSLIEETPTNFFHVIKQLFTMGLPFIAGRLSVSLRMFLITAMAAKLNLISLAVLGLATPFFLITTAFITGVIAAPISTLAQQTTRSDQADFHHTFQQALWFIVLLAIPLTFILYNVDHLF